MAGLLESRAKTRSWESIGELERGSERAKTRSGKSSGYWSTRDEIGGPRGAGGREWQSSLGQK